MGGAAPTPRPGDPFDLHVQVRPDDLDDMGHVNNVVYLRWVQAAATAHWNELATLADRRAIGWVVLRHEIDYRRPAGPGDSVIARTRVGVAAGLSFERHTEILDSAGRVLAVARTLWCPVDSTTGRPRRVPASVRDLFATTHSA